MTNWTCRDGGRCGIGGYCDDCWNIEKYSEKDLTDEKLELLDKVEKRILCLCRIDSNGDTVVDAFRIRKAIDLLKSEIENE